jgi:hypothetical protein
MEAVLTKINAGTGVGKLEIRTTGSVYPGRPCRDRIG